MSAPFQEQLNADLDAAFFCAGEFAEEHEVDGRRMLCVLDDNELTERKNAAKEGQHMDGLFLADRLLYVRADIFGALPKPGRLLMLDGKGFLVVDAADEFGVYSIYLEANRA
ncbi:hypothetical protein [Intestinibacillus massiliensis]